MQKEEKQQRTVIKTFRCTCEESERLEMEAEKLGLTVSAYVRERTLQKKKVRLPVQTETLLKELKGQTLKIGTNVNQIARVANTFGVVSKKNYQKLADQLSFLSGQYERIYRWLEKEMQDGDHKTETNQGE